MPKAGVTLWKHQPVIHIVFVMMHKKRCSSGVCDSIFNLFCCCSIVLCSGDFILVIIIIMKIGEKLTVGVHYTRGEFGTAIYLSPADAQRMMWNWWSVHFSQKMLEKCESRTRCVRLFLKSAFGFSPELWKLSIPIFRTNTRAHILLPFHTPSSRLIRRSHFYRYDLCFNKECVHNSIELKMIGWCKNAFIITIPTVDFCHENCYAFETRNSWIFAPTNSYQSHLLLGSEVIHSIGRRTNSILQ